MSVDTSTLFESLLVISGMVGGVISIPTIITTRVIKKLDQKIDRREEAAQEERAGMVLMIKALKANGQYTDAIAHAMEDGKINGKMHAARATHDAVSEELDNYLIKNAVNQMKER